MKKFLIITIIFSLSISLSGCFKKDKKDEGFVKLSDWLSSGQGVKCEVDSSIGKTTVKSEGKKVRIEGMSYIDPSNQDFQAEGALGTVLNDGEWIYLWGGLKGTKINMEEMKQLQAEDPDQDLINLDDYSWEKWATDQDDMQASYNCINEKFSADTFVAPSNVEFTDMTAFLRDMKAMSDSFINDIDLSQGIPEFENQFQLEELPQPEGSQEMTQEELEVQLEKMMNNL